MEDENWMDIHELMKRIQLGDHLDMDEVECFKDNKQYLKAARTFFLDVSVEADFLARNPSPRRMQERSKEYRERLKELLKKKELGEGEESFPSSRVFMENCLNNAQYCIVMLLLARRGMGLRMHSRWMSGETIILALKLLLDTEPEDARMLLRTPSSLMAKGFLEIGMDRGPRFPRRRRDHLREDGGVEDRLYKINEDVVDALYGSKVPVRRPREEEREEEAVKKVKSDVSLDQVILPKDIEESVLSMLEQYRNRNKFMEKWNMKSILGERKGFNLLLSGSPGTGKTMLAKALAKELDLDLYVLSFGDLVDCWYGNTEKNVSRVLDTLDQGSILLIDEADGVLQRRGPSRSSCDRTENRIVNILLQGMENHEGVMIFTTNVAIGLDRAVERRMDLKLELPIPDAAGRKEIWKLHIPGEMPLGEDVDIGALAEKYEFSGGHIRNGVLNAARRAIKNCRDEVIMEDFVRACQQELKGGEVMDYYMGKKEEEEVTGYY